MARVMLSYARDDTALLTHVVAALEAAGLSVWWDDAITPLAPWDETIERAIAEADAVLVLWTPQAVASEWVRAEAADAKEQKKLVPLVLAPCRVPLSFRLVQSADLTGWSGDPQDPTWQKVCGWISLLAASGPSASNALGSASVIETSPIFDAAIRARFARTNQIVERLTEDQFGVLRTLGTTRRVRIAGCAGSGKTLVACEKALRCANAGMRVLFLCHSPHLAAHVSGMIGASGVRVADFSNWVSAMSGSAERAGSGHWINVEEPDGATVDAAFETVLETQNHHCIIVDEGQDFRDIWWLLVEAALQDPTDSQLYIFHDDNQALLPYRASYPFDDPVLNLSRNVRNAGQIFEVVRRFHAHAPAPEAALGGHGFLAYFEAPPEQTDRAVDHCLRSLRSHGVLHDNRVLLLAGGLEKTPLVERCLVERGTLTEHWREIVRGFLEQAITTHVSKGILTPRDEALARIATLSQLSHEVRPTPQDVARVTAVARAIAVDDKVLRRLSGGTDASLDLSWRVVEGKLRFRRSLGGRLHGVEILRFFADPGWADGLSEVIRWHFDTAASGDRARVPIYDVAAFKGLEADTAIVLIGHHQPVSTEKLYVALSRARLALAIVDCSNGLTSFDPLRKIVFDHRHSSAADEAHGSGSRPGA